MPHKQNPTRSERLCGLAPVIRGMIAGYIEAAADQWDAHSLEHSSAERVVIPQISELTGFMLTEVADIASSLVIDEAAVARNVQAAPADSYAERNRLIREGLDGGEAWTRAKG
jgi:adenylosuccinate lyase